MGSLGLASMIQAFSRDGRLPAGRGVSPGKAYEGASYRPDVMTEIERICASDLPTTAGSRY